MDVCSRESFSSSAWQATSPGISKNLRRAFQLTTTDVGMMCHQQVPKKLTTEAVYMTFVLLTFAALTLIGSLIDAYENFRKVPAKKKLSDAPKKRPLIGVQCSESEIVLTKMSVWMKNCKPFLRCFSVLRNGKKLFSTVSNENHRSCLDGIRAIGFILVVLGHIFEFYVVFMKNDEEGLLESLNINAFAKGILAVDAFFVLSGFLNGYSVSCQYDENNGKISWLSYPLRRFIKMTPTQLIVLGFYTTLFSYLGSGPLWPNYDTNPVCKENWIWNLLYLNNFLPHEQQCMVINWNLACIMQMHIISPLFLIPLIRRPKIGYTLTIIAILSSCLASFVLIIQNNLINNIKLVVTDSPALVELLNQLWPYFDIVHSKPYTRLGSYLVGIVLGCYISNRKLSNIKECSQVTLSSGWIISILLLWFSSVANTHIQGPDYEIAASTSIKHLFYACSLSWIIFVCVTGQGGILNEFLSCKFFKILSRLSYSAYLIQILVMEKYFLSLEELMTYSVLSLVLISAYLLLWILIISFMVSLLFGEPVLRIYDLFNKKV
ncbi:unnamed protein product [Larinioides sclopetarius]|uniref:Acyltransferase 3 domain-containing protein n=1 Tax=Larinioides sclopetarius TaxID=280406 RepID=A0AAV2BXM9_9ARAC